MPGLYTAFSKCGTLVSNQQNNNDNVNNALQIAGGAGLVGGFSPHLRGKHQYYHGTAEENVPGIKSHGIHPSGKMREAGKTQSSILLDPKLEKPSDPYAFIDKSKLTAALYATQAKHYNAVPEDVRKEFRARYTRNGGFQMGSNNHAENTIKNTGKKIKGDLLGILHNYLTNKGIVKIEVPHHRLDKLKRNPEQKSDIPFTDPFINSKGVEGGVPSSWIPGGKNYKYFDMKGMRANPGRVGLGALGITCGMGLAAHGLHRFFNKDE